jgi:hypothetical protein
MLSPNDIYISENGTTLAIKPYWESVKELAVLEKTGLG